MIKTPQTENSKCLPINAIGTTPKINPNPQSTFANCCCFKSAIKIKFDLT